MIYTPHGRDAAIAGALLREAGATSQTCADLAGFESALGEDISLALVTEESLRGADLRGIGARITAQPAWSDLPFIVLTRGGGGPERNPAAAHLSEVLGNVTFLERPFHPITFISIARSALKGRLRQFEARARIEELRESEHRLQIALQAGRLGSWECDVEAEILTASATCKAVFGRKPDAPFTYQDLLSSIHPDDRGAMQAAVQASIAQGADYAIEYRTLWPDGSVHWAEIRARVVYDRQGDRPRLVGVSSDITERKTAACRLQQLNETLEERVFTRTAELRQAHDAVMAEVKQRERAEEQLHQAQKMEAIGQLTGGVAHDFNNLLTVIRSSVDLLKRPNLQEERRARYITAISDTVERAAKLTGQLLAFARRQALQPKIFAASDSVRILGDMLGTLTGSRIQVVMELPVERCFVNADPSQFDTALVNMAVNARDAMDGEGRLTIRVEAVNQLPAVRLHPAVPGDYVAVSLTDTGSGIPPDQLERIFEPFFTTKEHGKGTGLGLSQVFGFAKQSGGEVTVDSRLGEGTTFTIFLPLVSEHEQPAEAEETSLPMDGHGTRVLVVEDNADVGNFATQTLAELGYETVWTPTAEAALAELAKDASRFDVVFSDVVMPGIGGIELGRRIRREHHDLPVVLTSGYSHVLARHGTYGFELLHKPYSVEQLSRVLHKAAHWRQRQRSADL